MGSIRSAYYVGSVSPACLRGVVLVIANAATLADLWDAAVAGMITDAVSVGSGERAGKETVARADADETILKLPGLPACKKAIVARVISDSAAATESNSNAGAGSIAGAITNRALAKDTRVKAGFIAIAGSASDNAVATLSRSRAASVAVAGVVADDTSAVGTSGTVAGKVTVAGIVADLHTISEQPA